MKWATEKAVKYIDLLQMGTAKRAGTAINFHNVRRIVEIFGTASEYSMLAFLTA